MKLWSGTVPVKSGPVRENAWADIKLTCDSDIGNISSRHAPDVIVYNPALLRPAVIIFPFLADTSANFDHPFRFDCVRWFGNDVALPALLPKDDHPRMRTAYLAADGLVPQLAEELRRGSVHVATTHGRLLIAEGDAIASAWAANVWHDVQEIAIDSIGDAAQKLRAVQRNWAMYAPLHYRRAALIQNRLPHVSAKPLTFPGALPTAPLGSWTLLAPDRILHAARCASPCPNGEIAFVEDRSGPPSRAYLKLWEAFTRLGMWPGPGARCLDLGATPGGWTWVMAKLGAEVIAVDKAPLDPAVASMPGVAWRGESAFALDPESFGRIDWLCADIICYPARLLNLVQRWLAAGTVRHVVCTLKFQGDTDHDTAAAFAAIPGGRLFHAHHNKHELTWVRLG
jgi:23S rRNA (cytidine2498-2'-O)-methyltransferase